MELGKFLFIIQATGTAAASFAASGGVPCYINCHLLWMNIISRLCSAIRMAYDAGTAAAASASSAKGRTGWLVNNSAVASKTVCFGSTRSPSPTLGLRKELETSFNKHY